GGAETGGAMRTREPWNRSSEQLGHMEKDTSSGTSGVTPPPIWLVARTIGGTRWAGIARTSENSVGRQSPLVLCGSSGVGRGRPALNRAITIPGRAGLGLGTERPPASDYDSRRTSTSPGQAAEGTHPYPDR